MLAFCPRCWNEIMGSPTTCRKCGTAIDVNSAEYENQLFALIPQSTATKRAEICLVLGQREKRSAVPHLVSLFLSDENAVVRIAVLRALEQIGDASAVPEVTKIAANETSPLHAFAKHVLSSLTAQGVKS